MFQAVAAYKVAHHTNMAIITRICKLLFPVFIHFQSVCKHQATEETFLSLLHPVFSFQLIDVTIILSHYMQR